MISTKDLSGLPNAERLKNFCKGLATLDIIMVEEEWSFIRHYTYNPAWRKGKEAFFATDGSDQSMIVLFAPEGCVINGVDSELYDWEAKLPRIEDLTDGMPPALQKLMGSREVKKMKSTFCVWTEDGTTWHCNPMDGEDASKDLLPLIDGDPQTYVEYGKWFYPADLPIVELAGNAPAKPTTKLNTNATTKAPDTPAKTTAASQAKYVRINHLIFNYQFYSFVRLTGCIERLTREPSSKVLAKR